MSIDRTRIAQACLSSAVVVIVLLSSFLTLAGSADANKGTLDSFGYYYVDSKMPYPTVNYSWIEINSTGTNTGLNGGDVSNGPHAIGFDFNFYGTLYSQMYVNSKGQVLFLGSSTDWTNDNIPNANTPNGYIAAYWDDLQCSATYGSAVYYQTMGSAPERQLVVEWHNVTPYGSASPLMTFEIILNETGEIWLQYNKTNGWIGSSATVGIERQNGTAGCLYSYNTPSLSDGLAIRIKADPQATLSPADYSDWGSDPDGDSLYDELIVEVGVHVNVTGNYNVTGMLFDGVGTYIDFVENYSFMSTGLNLVDLHFDGLMLYQHGWNGTYNLDIYLWNSIGTMLENDSYTTASYTYDQFEGFPAATISPGGIDLSIFIGNITTTNLTIGNVGLGDLSYNITNISSTDWEVTTVILNETFSSSPTNWTITNLAATAWLWQNNRMENTYSYPSSGYLDSPVLDCGLITETNISFWHFWQASWSGATQDGYVRGSIDGGATWPYLIADFHHLNPSSETAVKEYEIPWADGQSQVRIRFDIYNFNDWYWRVDDVVVKGKGSVPQWLTVSPLSGLVIRNGSQQLDITVNATDISPGIHRVNITLETNDPSHATIIIPVNVTVTLPPHDIRVIDLDMPSVGGLWHNVTFNATIRNQGANGENSVSVNLLIDNVTEDTYVISSIASWSYANVVFQWVPTSADTYYISIWAEPVAGELNTENNWFNSTIDTMALPSSFHVPHSDYGVETDGDGYYEFLAIDIGLDINASGKYTIIAGLLAGATNIGAILKDYTLSVGIQTVELRFPTGSLIGNGVDGPYTVNMILFDSSGTLNDMDNYTTAAYFVSQFDTTGARINTPITDIGWDESGNGLYESLVLNVTIEVSASGTYNLTGKLFGNGIDQITSASSIEYLTAGTQTVQLRFDGTDIRGSGNNSPYFIVLNLKSGSLLLDATIYSTTNPYLWNDFEAPDSTPPATVISLAGTPGSNGWFVSNVSVTLTATDGGWGVNVTMYRIDGGSWTIYNGSFNMTVDGNYTMEFYSDDYASNVEATKNASVMIDKVAPQTVSYSYDYNLLLIANDGVDGSGINVTLYRVFDNTSGIWGAWTNYSGMISVGSGPGDYFVEFCSVDVASNNESDMILHNITLPIIDSIPPVTTATTSGKSGANSWFRSAVEITLTATDDKTGINYTKYRVNGGSWTNYTAPIQISGEGTQTVEFYSIDYAGNTETTKSRSVKIDTVAPALAIDQVNGTTYNVSAITISWTSSDATSGIDHFEVVVDYGPFVRIDATVLSTTLNLSDGNHLIIVRAVDKAGMVTEKRVDIVISLPPSPPGPEPPADIFGGMLPLLLLIIVALAACLVVFFLLKRRKKDGQEATMAPPMEQQTGGPQVPPQNPPESPPEFKFN